jgi:NTE family protein
MTVRAVVFSGGGVKGAWQVAACKALMLARPELSFDMVAGVSTGALTGAVLAQAGPDRSMQVRALAQVERVYLDLAGNGDIYEGGTGWISRAWHLLRWGAFHRPTGLRALLSRHLDVLKLHRGLPFRCGTVDLDSGEYLDHDGKSAAIVEAVLASASMPVYFPPVQIRGLPGRHVDGGIANITPLATAVGWLRRHPDPDRELYVFLASPLEVERAGPRTGLAVAGRSLELILHEIYLNDLRELESRNFHPKGGRDVQINVAVGCPAVSYGDALNFDPALIRRMLADGAAFEMFEPSPLLSLPSDA